MLKRWSSLIRGGERSLQDRLFTLATLVLALGFAVFAVFNIATATSAADKLVLAAMLILLGIVAALSLKRKRDGARGVLISALLAFVLLPCIFFFSGGIYGGAPIWFVFAALFVSLILSGRARIILLGSEMAVASVCYILAYSRPDLVRHNSAVAAYADSFAVLVFISLAVSVIVSFEIALYQEQSKQAERQRQEIEALNVSQNRFFSSMSHEIRTPINTIIGLNEMILREDVSDEVAEDAANIQSASRMLLHLVNDILDMSKLESGSMQLTLVNYRIGDMLSELVGMFWGLANEKGLEFHVSVAPDVPAELFGDDVRIRQILINVLNNAVKYTREGSVTLSIQCGARQGTTQNLIFTVIDTGIGIKKESIPYLFTAFKRVDEEKNRHIEGTGLGLAIVKQLVELMGGTITVNSVYTQGSTFVIELPQQVSGEGTVGALDVESSRGDRRSAYRARFEAPEASVLAVDDNASNLLVVEKLLRDTKVRLDKASSGEEALRMTLEKGYHVIFMDHLMPGMDGVECRRRILAQPGGKCRESKIIALTANADGQSRALYEREGFDGYLTKPLNAAALENELYRHLPEDLRHTLDIGEEDLLRQSVAWIQAPNRKRMLAVTTESVADLPQELLERYDIATLPHIVATEHGVFRDGLDLEANGLMAYMADPRNEVKSGAPDVAAHEAFFSRQLGRAYNVFHIVLSSGVSNSAYPAAMEAAASFNNVTVLDSGHLSGGQGLMVLEACRLAEAGLSAAEIAQRLEKMKERVQTSFIVDNLDYLARAHQVPGRVALLTKSLSIRPVIALGNGRMRLSRVYLGERKRAWKRYIKSVLGDLEDADKRMLFITYVGLSRQELAWVRQQVEALSHFDDVYCQKAAPAIAANCGPGCFGLLYLKKEA